jgi:hypothetical protein
MVPHGPVAVALVFTALFNLETVRSHWIFPDRVHRAAAVLGLGQGWGMYAPSPYNEGFRLEIRGTHADGSARLLDAGGTGTSWPPVARMRDGYRAKIYLEWIATGGWDVAVHHFADWVCRAEHAAGDTQNPIRSVAVVKLVGDSPAIPTTPTGEVTLSSFVCDPA